MDNIAKLIFIIIGISSSVYCCKLFDYEKPQFLATEPYSQVFFRMFRNFYKFFFKCEHKDYLKTKHKDSNVKVCEQFEDKKETLKNDIAKDMFIIIYDSTTYLNSFTSKCVFSPVVKQMYIWTNYVQMIGSYNEKEAHAFMHEVIRIAKTFIFPKMNITQKKNKNEIETKEDEEDIA